MDRRPHTTTYLLTTNMSYCLNLGNAVSLVCTRMTKRARSDLIPTPVSAIGHRAPHARDGRLKLGRRRESASARRPGALS